MGLGDPDRLHRVAAYRLSMNKHFARRACITLLVSALPFVAFAQPAAPTDFKSLAGFIVTLINAAIAVLLSAAVLYYMYGVVNAMRAGDSTKGWERLRAQAGWGIFAIFIMFFVWAIVRVLGNTLFGSNNFSTL